MIKNAKTFPPDPTPKYPPRRNGLDWHGLQRCGNHWGIFVFPPRRQKGATSIEPCHIIRNTGDHEAHSLRTFVVSLRQV